MDINGENLNYHHGPPSVKSFQWPGPDPTENKLMFNLVSRGTPLSVRTDGEWSWFRMLDAHAITTPNRAGGLLVTFALNGIASTQELRPAGNQHPFNPELLEGFAPPGRL
jgi:type VI secretion system protein ImpL